jgi:hypothetical protein
VSAKQDHLFPEMNPARYGEHRRKRPLFIPARLKSDSQDRRLQGQNQETAHEILIRWAELESSGALEGQKESNIEAELLTQVFGEALGYTLFSEGQKQWNLKPKFRLNSLVADAAIGFFETRQKAIPRAVIELKGPTVNVDKDKFNGRTPVQQCWDYLNEAPECPWGIVCNCVSFRLYHRDHTPRVYELFTLQDLRKRDVFAQFYYVLERGGLLPTGIAEVPRADSLLERCGKRQREVGDRLYEYYHDHRVALIEHLTSAAHEKSLDAAIRMAQKLVDRIIFVAFCEDRGLLPERSLFKAWNDIPPFYRVTNPRWQNFRDLFRTVDEGNEAREIPGYDGGLFRNDPMVDDLQLEDEWTDFFKNIGDYDFRYEVNVDVLGHLFEKSINDIERIRLGGLFESNVTQEITPKMKKSAERKRGGIYYTPPEFTSFITHHTVGFVASETIDHVAAKHKVNLASGEVSAPTGSVKEFVEEAVESLRSIKIVDPACGSGAFLIRAYETLEEYYLDLLDTLENVDSKGADALRDQIGDFILHDNLHGVDLSPEAVEITQLALWLRSARRGKTLADLSKNIVCGNSLVTDKDVDPMAIDWTETFPEIFSRDNAGFDSVIGNPPWERIKLQEREFFDSVVPEIAAAVNAARRRKLIAELKKNNPEIHQRYLQAKKSAERTLEHVRKSGRYPLCGKGDINTYAVFAELAKTIVAANGRVGLLVPSGIATDKTTKDFFGELVAQRTLAALYDFENKAPMFPDVHRSYKFCVLLFGGPKRESTKADFVFFAHRMEELRDKNRHVMLSRDDFKRLNPNTLTCPVFRSTRDAEITKAIYQRVPVLLDQTRKQGGNPWGIRFFTMFHQTNDAELFKTRDELEEAGFKRDGAVWKKRKNVFLPLYEAKMIQMYDHRAASVVLKDTNWMRQGQTDRTSLVQHQNPEYCVEPRWWVVEDAVNAALGPSVSCGYIAFKDVTSPTNMRTMIAAFVPHVAALNSAPLMLTADAITVKRESCVLANLNSFALDFVARQKVGGVHLNFFIVEQFPVFGPEFYEQPCPWNKREKLETWISQRVFKLTCTSNDMKPLAEAAGFKPPVHRWNPAERRELEAQLDAAFFILYGIERTDVEYILSTFSGIRKEQEGILTGETTFNRILTHYDNLNR